MATLATHEATKLFPLLTGNDFDTLVRDIKENGQQQPVLMLNGILIDGRNRLRACQKLNLKPKTKQIKGDPLSIVMSLNYHRRHLKSHEKGESLRQYLLAKRGTPGKAKGGRPKKNGKPPHNGAVSAASIAKELGVPKQTVQRQIKAAETYASLPKAVQKKVDSGECPLEIAPKVASTIDREVGKLNKPAVAEVQRIEDETNKCHRHTNATMKWLQSVETGCRFHEEFLLSNRWSKAEREIIQRVARNMANFTKRMKGLKQ